MSRAIVVHSNAASEVSQDRFVAVCIAFQQAKNDLSQHLGNTDLTQLDNVSQAVYHLANKALRRKMKDAPTEHRVAVQKGEKLPFREIIAAAVKGRKQFTISDVADALKKRRQLPVAQDVPAYISTTLGTSTDLFTRVERGVYKFKKSRPRLTLKKAPKALEAAPA